MNIQPGRSWGKVNRKKQKVQIPFSIQMLSLGKWVIGIGVLASIFIVQTSIRQRINNVEAKIRAEKRECARLRHAIECSDIRIAQLTEWSHVNAKIQRYHLNLTPIRGSVYQLTQRTPQENAERFSAWQNARRQMSAMTAKSR